MYPIRYLYNNNIHGNKEDYSKKHDILYIGSENKIIFPSGVIDERALDIIDECFSNRVIINGFRDKEMTPSQIIECYYQAFRTRYFKNIICTIYRIDSFSFNFKWFNSATSPFYLHTRVPVKKQILASGCKIGDFVAVGARHYSSAMVAQIEHGNEDIRARESRILAIQGFIDQYDTFYGRRSALDLVLMNGQPMRDPIDPSLYNDKKALIFSENLW